MKPAVIDLFCGIGGLGLGAVRAGFHLALSVDNDATLLGVHKLNFPGFPHLEADIGTLTGSSLLATAKLSEGELAGLVGGSPCQGFSRIGKRNHADERNVLFAHFFRLVSEARPAFFIAENVQGILDQRNRKLVKRALAHVPSNYRVLEPFVLNAADFGAATARKRVFFVGYIPDRVAHLTHSDFTRMKWPTKTTVGEALAGLPRRLRDTWLSDELGWRPLRVRRRGKFWSRIYGVIPPGVGDEETVRKFLNSNLVSGCVATKHTKEVEARFSKLMEGSTDVVSRMHRLRRGSFCPTLRAGTGPDKGSFQALRPIHFSEPRVITPREAARLQGFPDWFRFDSTKWHAFRGVGNSVSPFVAEALFSAFAGKLQRGS